MFTAGEVTQLTRAADFRVVEDFLRRASAQPASLLIEGEPGIGKTTLWLQVIERAAAQGYRVLSAQGSPVAVSYAYAVVTDLLAAAVDAETLTSLPTAQRAAVERVLLGESTGPATDERTVAAAFLAIVERIESQGPPVLVAVDDAQWLDASSQAVISHAGRRMSGRTGLLVTVRSGESEPVDAADWLQFFSPEALVRIRMSPLSLGGVHALISARLGRSLPRPALTRIYEISGGNPFFALELARAVGPDTPQLAQRLPATLAALVAQHIGAHDDETGAMLLAAACTAAPTVELIGRATTATAQRVAELLKPLEANGIVAFNGDRLRFIHPIYATGVYSGATAPRRRAMHRALAEIVDQPEAKARHLALAATTSDASTQAALDAAARVVSAQGAPAVAGELVDLAIALGGDTPTRRLRAAELHFRAGSFVATRRHLEVALAELRPGVLRCVALLLLGAVEGYDGDLRAAVNALTEAVDAAGDNAALRVQGLVMASPGFGLIGRRDESLNCARRAIIDADALGDAGLRSQARAIWVNCSFIYGHGVDRQALTAALELEQPETAAGITFQASAVDAIITAWSGDLHGGRDKMRGVLQRAIERGTEVDIIWAVNHAVMIEVWLGRYDDAAAMAADAVQRAEQLGGSGHTLATGHGSAAAVAAHAGRVDDARAAATAAMDLAHATGGEFLTIAPRTALGLLEVSLGNHAAAVDILAPLLDGFDPAHGTEIMAGGWIPDAVEALTVLGRVEEATALIEALEYNGSRHDRLWMLAMGARGRAHLLAAEGNLAAAEQAAEQALSHHERLPMPFETARTQLLLGSLQRRRRRNQTAARNLQDAEASFQRLGAPLWAQRARTESDRLSTSHRAGELTATELCIAERAAEGLSNKEIAAALSVSVKAVETHLGRVYHKLQIGSRAGLSVSLRTIAMET